jgi:hypothetical protein
MVHEDLINMGGGAERAMDTLKNRILNADSFLKTQHGAVALAESSELFVRLSGLFGAITSGMDPRTAAKSISRAMLDYSDITNFERTVLKRGTFFYTYPRKMIPKSLEYMFNHPDRVTRMAHGVMQPLSASPKDAEEAADKSVDITYAEGRPELRVGDYRVNMARMATQLDAMTALGSIADMIFPGLAEERAVTGLGAADKPMGPAMLPQVLGLEEFFPVEDPLKVDNKHWLTEGINSNWLLTLLSGDKVLGSNDPEVDYSPLELAARSFAPYRKVRVGQEEGRQIRRIRSHKRNYSRELERATAEGNEAGAQYLTTQIAKMDSAISELTKKQRALIRKAEEKTT